MVETKQERKGSKADSAKKNLEFKAQAFTGLKYYFKNAAKHLI